MTCARRPVLSLFILAIIRDRLRIATVVVETPRPMLYHLGMETASFDPVAEILVQSYLGTLVYSRKFTDDFEQPPTTMAKSHHLRSIAQALVNQCDRYKLDPEYAEMGRVAFIDLETQAAYVVRSSSHVAIEENLQPRLFPVTYIDTPIRLLIYRFHYDGLDLSLANTRRVSSKRRVEAAGKAEYIGTWPYTSADDLPPFDQGKIDPFRELGDIREEDDGDGEVEGGDVG